ncbi:hypothetical protein DYB36_004934 [Aphanomyces astaci]|uniref:Uncharacterized protein n=1 Tax=Aphanomyces astaci TaxID=112090 RepID=A0A397AQD8_APHAT|nr:hypothetical protein DYB36_004934 [Aphanomyces astaci]
MDACVNLVQYHRGMDEDMDDAWEILSMSNGPYQTPGPRPHFVAISLVIRRHPLDVNFKRLIQHDAALPKQFLYSSADPIVPASHVEYAAATAKALGIPVASVDFEVSNHVSLVTFNPDLYIQSIQEFLPKHGVGVGVKAPL